MKVDGPYAHGRRFRLRIRENGAQRIESFDTQEEALRRLHRLRREAEMHATATVVQAVEAYRTFMAAKGNRPRSVDVTAQRLATLFRLALHKPVGALHSSRAELVSALDGYRWGSRQKPLSIASKRNLINQGKTFLNWCKAEGLMKANPLEGYQVLGRVNRGKAQLTADESLRFLAKCYQIADEAIAGRRTVRRLQGSSMSQLEGAVASAAALWLGRRASELVDRQVRDLDRGGTVLNVSDAKTVAGIGAYEVPAQLQPYLRRLAAGRAPMDKLFGPNAGRHGLLRWVKRICRLAGLPVVSPHGLRGTWGSLARKNGAALEAVSRALGHASTSVTAAHYVQPSAENSARQKEVSELLGRLATNPDSALASAPQNAPNFGTKLDPNSALASEKA